MGLRAAGLDYPAEKTAAGISGSNKANDKSNRNQDPEHKIQQLQNALNTRIAIEQAKGVLAERFRLPIEEAFDLLRYSARANRTSLHALAATVISHPDITPEEIAATLAQPDRWRTLASSPSQNNADI